MGIVLVIVSFLAQGLAFSLGRILKGIPGRILDMGVIAVGLLFAAPPLLLAKTDIIPVGIWSVSWIGAYFIGNIQSPIKKVVFLLWFILTAGAMVWLMPE